MFEEKRNVHRFFDDYSGEWVELPITWELHSEYVQTLLSQIEVEPNEICQFIDYGIKRCIGFELSGQSLDPECFSE